MVQALPNVTALAASYGVAGMSWSTLDAQRTRVDTPQDRIERLDWGRLGPQVAATAIMIERWVQDEAFAIRRGGGPAQVVRIHGTIVDQAPGEPVARVPMEGYLTTLIGGHSGKAHDPPLAGVRRHEFVRTGPDGRFRFDGWSCAGHGIASVLAHRLGDDGRIVRAVNQQNTKGTRLSFSRRSRRPPPLRATVFTCRELSVVELFDPRALMTLPQATVLDARRGGTPKRMDLWVYGGMLSCQLEHGVRWQALLRAGIIGNRMVLVNMLPADEAAGLSIRESMRGFGEGEGPLSHPFLAAARDFHRLDARRLADYRKAGIRSRPIEELQEKTRTELEAAAAAFDADDGAGFFRHAMGALANEVRGYRAVRDTATDVIRGAIFLLLLLVPFSYAMERLLFASPHIYRQIGGGVAVFTVMAVVLWSFHPAFRMSSMPLMIIVAFGIIFMSLMVIMMIFSKFETEVEKMRSGMAEASGAKTSRLGLLTTSVRLGIANMRRRKLRTTLTGLTVMLITFALLCFMSTSTYVGRHEFTVRGKAAAPAVLIRRPGEQSMPVRVRKVLRTLVGERYDIVPRFWWCNPMDEKWRLHVRNPATGRQISLQAAVGLAGEEDRVTGIDRVCPDWPAFQAGHGCYLAAGPAAQLGVRPGDPLVVAGHEVTLVGVFDAARLDREVRRLDGQSLLPPDYSLMDEQQKLAGRAAGLQAMALEMESGAGLYDEPAVPPLSGEQVILLPAELLYGCARYTLRNLAIPTGSVREAGELAERLSERLAFPVYFGSPAGVRVIAAIPLTPKAPKSLLFPLVIAGLIIFNTMLSSLAERHREIYVYTSLGLAPMHIAVLFLAEAVTYALLGSIAGYVLGQGLATVFSALGWMGSMTLNFGGTQAIMTMLLVLAIVVASSLVPAYLAGRTAMPSNEMRWTVPAPIPAQGGPVIRDALPFTASARTAAGVIAFLCDYFEAHQDGTIGSFTAADVRAAQRRDERPVRLLLYAVVWLAPYDLGVRQGATVTLTGLEDEEDLYEIGIELQHRSGQMGTWRKLNRTFLAELRRQLLGWRHLTAERVDAYIEAGNRLLVP
ncbi:ABC transporter permease [Verrucomicrobiota bacterium]